MSTKKQSNLTPIMFTDIVGYSSMVAKDEKNALKLLDEHNELIFPIIKSNDGEVIKLIGDAIFARFKLPAGAINTAIEVQSKLKQRNSISSRKPISLFIWITHGSEVFRPYIPFIVPQGIV